MSQLSQTLSGTRSITEEEIESVAKECARYFVNKSGSSLPIKRPELLKFVSAIREDYSRHLNSILQRTSKLLQDVYGYKIKELDSKNQYLLILCDDSEDLHENDSSNHILLMAILSHIFMSGGSVKEDALWKFLEKAGLLSEHDQVVKKMIITQFTKELYLKHIKVGELDNTRYVFEWGHRANAEIPKMYLLKKVAEALGKSEEYWTEQYKDASRSSETQQNTVVIN